MAVGTMEVFKRLAKLARGTNRVLAPYSKLQKQIFAAAKARSLHGVTSRTLNMRKSPSLANPPRVLSPPSPVEIPSDVGLIQDSAAQLLSPFSGPLSYASRLRIPQASLARQIARQPLWQARIETARQLQPRITIPPIMTGAGRSNALGAIGTTRAELPIRTRVEQSSPSLSTEVTPVLPFALPTSGTAAPPLVPRNTLQAAPAKIGPVIPNVATSLGSKLSEGSSQLSSPSPQSVPVASKFYSQALKLSKTVRDTLFLRRNTVTSRVQNQVDLNTPTSSGLAGGRTNQGSTHPLLAPSVALEGATMQQTPPTRAGVNLVKPPTVRAASESRDLPSSKRSPHKLLVNQPAIQLTRTVMLNLAKIGALKPATGASTPARSVAATKSTPAVAGQPQSQNRERLVTTLAEMETAQTKMQLTNRNPMPQLPRVELPRIQAPPASKSGGTFTVQENDEASRPVELGGNTQALSPLRDAMAVPDWTTPEPETLSSTNELRLRIAKILEEEARRYLPEE